jgi:hypothetical protein
MQPVTLLSKTAQTATVNGAEAEIPANAIGGRIYLRVSAASGTTPTLDVKIQSEDPTSGQWIDIPGAAFAQKTGVSTDELTIYPGVTVAANRAVSTILTHKLRAVATIGGTTPSFDFTVCCCPVVG